MSNTAARQGAAPSITSNLLYRAGAVVASASGSRVPQWKRIVGLASGARPGKASERGERPGE